MINSATYAQLVASKLEKFKNRVNLHNAPEDVQTSVIFRVSISPKGELLSYQIIQKSSDRFFNKAGTKIIQLASPFPIPPQKAALSNIVIPIRFNTNS